MFSLEYFFIGLILNLIIFKLCSPFLKSHFLINPIKISSHKNPTPSGAGLFFVISTLILTVYRGLSNGFSFVENFILISTILCFVGLLDDYFGLSRIFRFLVQLLVVFLIIAISPFSDLNFFLLSLICFFGVSIVNLINFTDGIDGLLAGSILVSLIGANLYLSISPLIFTLTAGLLIFLFLNWHPAKFFMGDAGSLFLGAIYFGIILNSNNFEDMIRIFLLATPLFADATFCILRRLFCNENIFKGHNKHLFQRLVRGGMSHSKVSKIYIGTSIFLALVNYFLNLYMLITSSILVIAFGFYFDRYAVNFSKES